MRYEGLRDGDGTVIRNLSRSYHNFAYQGLLMLHVASGVLLTWVLDVRGMIKCRARIGDGAAMLKQVWRGRFQDGGCRSVQIFTHISTVSPPWCSSLHLFERRELWRADPAQHHTQVFSKRRWSRRRRILTLASNFRISAHKLPSLHVARRSSQTPQLLKMAVGQ